MDSPISLFNTLSLQYIFANNLTQVINGILQKIDVSLGPKQNSADSEKQNVDELLAVLASIITDLNLSQVENEEANRVSVEPINDAFLRSALKKTSNILYQPETFLSKQMYELENGQIIVEDCKNNIDSCQFEGIKSISKKRLR